MTFKISVKTEVEVTTLIANMGRCYWEDGYVNGEQDDEVNPRMPFATPKGWALQIDLETGAIKDWPHGTTASVHYKVCDEGVYSLLNAAGETIITKDGYVPRMMCPKDNGYGDYVIMDIFDDGKISGWKADLSYFDED